MLAIDLNCDMGESYGAWSFGADEQIMPLISSANIACGFHGGDPTTIVRTVRLAVQHGVAVGAHPSYPDLMGFGRRSMHLSADEVRALILYQVGAVEAIARAYGTRVRHVKLHGALYNDAAASPELASTVAQALRSHDPHLPLYVLAGSPMVRVARELGVPVLEEAFADRTYEPDGSLRSRSLPDSVITDPVRAAEQVRLLVVERRVLSASGASVPVRADTICVHGDNPAAVEVLTAVRAELTEAGVVITALGEPEQQRAAWEH